MAKNCLEQLKTEIFQLLRCPMCGSEKLNFKTGNFPIKVSFKCHNEFLECVDCQNVYPITHDHILVMWDSYIKDFLLNETKKDSALAANIEFYDEFSADYYQHTRISSEFERRMQSAVMSVTGDLRDRVVKHLDWGCGPGQVIKWLSKFGFDQFGLDVSLSNLRNTRKNTGAKVICGSVTNIPFKNSSFDLITESSVLHHIEDWKRSIEETCRVCSENGKVIIDSEPSKQHMDWSKLAVFVFDLRFPVYKILSYFMRSKYAYRDMAKAKLQVKAEIHHQPGTGICLDTLVKIFENNGYKSRIIYSPTLELGSKVQADWKSFVLNVLSLRNPYNPKYGLTTIIAF